jgi:hypothetical protein
MVIANVGFRVVAHQRGFIDVRSALRIGHSALHIGGWNDEAARQVPTRALNPLVIAANIEMQVDPVGGEHTGHRAQRAKFRDVIVSPAPSVLGSVAAPCISPSVSVLCAGIRTHVRQIHLRLRG